MKQFIDEAINSEKDKRRHEHLPPLTPLEDARLRVKLMETYFFGTVATLAVIDPHKYRLLVAARYL